MYYIYIYAKMPDDELSKTKCTCAWYIYWRCTYRIHVESKSARTAPSSMLVMTMILRAVMVKCRRMDLINVLLEEYRFNKNNSSYIDFSFSCHEFRLWLITGKTFIWLRAVFCQNVGYLYVKCDVCVIS